ncbi:MAG: ribosome recycling factor [Gemmatimonadota bacterium]|jgi:ribosome recycling factor|nr:ribosome recycling factor [Gemmatimonadota bacterium]MDP6461365.1 ribosome recycling factor [Gemmatimonadota bacterium]MDP6528861.1 ribosome recycling factor [Gemmatimonadota bacterium]MDP6802415.1 ribosome recycling factor [Gemmatimonadota bacterium]MDP7031070.1 ribosome recycling factor [Gemmatimonadota bacterium]
MSEEIFKACQGKMKDAVDATQRELSKLRAGRATTAILDGILVDAYGSQTPINQVGTVGVPEPRLLVIQPWDKGLIGPIEKAIQSADLGLNPANDGQVIRIPIPALTEERRKEIVKGAGGQVEDGRVAVRIARREANDALKKARKDGTLSEDEEHRAHDRIQELTNQFVKELDEVFAKKEAEILEI